MNHNPFKNALEQLLKAAAIAKIDPNIVKQLERHNRLVEVSVPIKRTKTGQVQVFDGFRAQHNNARGPYKGGIRFHQRVSVDEVKALSLWMSLKTAVVDIPMGGGKGGLVVNPKELDKGELEALARGYARRIADVIGPDKDVPAPDVNTDPQIMDWIKDEYEKIVGHPEPAVITGKPVKDGGSEGRDVATSEGAFYVWQAMEKKINLGLTPDKTRVAIIGFGNAGHFMAKRLAEAGYKVVSVSDSHGGIYDPQGLDPDQILKHKQKTGTVVGYQGHDKPLSVDEQVGLDVDLLIPAALENQITEDNAPHIKAQVVLEIANGPTTMDADLILQQKNIPVVPDILANAGGVTVSYYEWLQNRSRERWTREQVFTKLLKKMTLAFDQVYKTAQDKKISLRQAAGVVAVTRLAQAMADETTE